MGRDVQDCKEQIKELRAEVTELAGILRDLTTEMQREKERRQYEQENLKLQLRVAFVEFEKRLLSGGASTE